MRGTEVRPLVLQSASQMHHLYCRRINNLNVTNDRAKQNHKVQTETRRIQFWFRGSEVQLRVPIPLLTMTLWLS